jgi:hypothetical protein
MTFVMHEPKFKVGDLVMFARTVQNCTTGMEVQKVDSNAFDSLLMVNHKWWHEECFSTLKVWQDKCAELSKLR